MRQLPLTILLLLTATILRGQEIDLEKVRFRGLDFTTTKEKVIKAFGQGKRVETNYECGFFTNDQELGPYYQLVYNSFDYIGSDKDKFFLQHVNFDTKGEIKLDYLNTQLSGQTTIGDFTKIFGDKVIENFEKHLDQDVVSILVYSKGSDDGAVFTFKNNKLVKFQYWTPC